MKLLMLLVLFIITLPAFAKEDCSLKGIDLKSSSNIAERLYYTGTCHYRNKEYELSANAWEQLLSLKEIDPDYQDLRVDVLNNLGYLMFFGYGITQNQDKALSFWQQAIALGHYESEYHLCHAHADKNQSSYNISKAKKHCEKALLIYNGMEEKDYQIIDILNQYNVQVNGR